MATTQTTPVPPGPAGPPAGNKGCSRVVVFMVATLCFVIGLLAGAGGFYGAVTQVDGMTDTLQLDVQCPEPVVSAVPSPECPACPTLGAAEQCPPCPQAAPCPTPAVAGADRSFYALVYPIEETLRIEGVLKNEQVSRKVATERFRFQQCYQTELDKQPSLKGEIALQFTVANTNGKVLAALPRQNMTGSDVLANCITSQIRTWEFKPIKGDTGMSVVRFDALFLPISSANSAP